MHRLFIFNELNPIIPAVGQPMSAYFGDVHVVIRHENRVLEVNYRSLLHVLIGELREGKIKISQTKD